MINSFKIVLSFLLFLSLLYIFNIKDGFIAQSETTRDYLPNSAPYNRKLLKSKLFEPSALKAKLQNNEIDQVIDADGTNWTDLENDWHFELNQFFENKYGTNEGKVLFEKYIHFKKNFWNDSNVKDVFHDHDQISKNLLELSASNSDETELRQAKKAYMKSKKRLRIIQKKYNHKLRSVLSSDYDKISILLKKFNFRSSERNGLEYSTGLVL